MIATLDLLADGFQQEEELIVSEEERVEGILKSVALIIQLSRLLKVLMYDVGSVEAIVSVIGSGLISLEADPEGLADMTQPDELIRDIILPQLREFRENGLEGFQVEDIENDRD